MTAFSDRPFAAGSLIGMRAFAVDSLGRLQGPSYAQIFRPGENEAECRKRDDSWSSLYRSMAASYDRAMLTALYGPTSLPPTPTRRPSSHSTGGRLKGYFKPGGVLRAEYEAVSEQVNDASKRLDEEAVERVEPPAPPPHTLAGLDCTCGFYAYFNGQNDYKDPTRVTALIEGYGVCTVGSAGFRASKARLVAVVRPGKRVATELIERNYPDVPFYDRKRDALEAHPLTTDPVPSPDEDDFWTREAR